MKALLAVVMAGLLALGQAGFTELTSVAKLPAGLAAPVAALVSKAATAVRSAPIVVPVNAPKQGLNKLGALSMPKNPGLAELEEPVEIIRAGRHVVIPKNCRTSDGTYDVLVHFHGAPTSVKPAFEASGIQAILVIVNLGIGSGPYERGYGTDGSLGIMLERVDKLVDKHCPSLGKRSDRTRGKVALSSWSAGYGATYRILANEKDRQLVDAVLLADGLHSGFVDKRRRIMSPLQMAMFDRFAEDAIAGEKLFAITHTGIVTPGYASTTETANYLVKGHDVPREKTNLAGPRESMRQTSHAEKGSFFVTGYAGNDTHAHCDHLYAIGDTLFSKLAARWAR